MTAGVCILRPISSFLFSGCNRDKTDIVADYLIVLRKQRLVRISCVDDGSLTAPKFSCERGGTGGEKHVKRLAGDVHGSRLDCLQQHGANLDVYGDQTR